VDRWPDSLMDSGRTLSIHIYDLAMNVPGGERNAYAAALVLIALLLVINVLASRAANSWLRRGYAGAAA
jgi:phosphate transport system permease protein